MLTLVKYALHIFHRFEELKREGLSYAEYLDPQSLPYVGVPSELEKHVANANSGRVVRWKEHVQQLVT